MIKASILGYQVREPYPLTIKVITEFEPQACRVLPRPRSQEIIARIFLYTSDQIYKGVLTMGDINQQLDWTQNSLSILIDSMGSKRSNIDLRFSQTNGAFTLIPEIDNGIRVTMFEIILMKLEGDPLYHMKTVILGYRDVYDSQDKKIKNQRDSIKTQIKQIVALGKRIEDQTHTEVIHLKKCFVDVINQCKKQLRKHMKPGISEVAEEDEEETITKGRKIVRVNRQVLEQVESRQMPMDIQVQHRGFQSLFDDVQ